MEWFKKRADDEVEVLYNEMIQRSKGEYVTRSVSFKKNSPEQMELLKKSLMVTAPFSMLVRAILEEFDKSPDFQPNRTTVPTANIPITNTPSQSNTSPNKSIGNFI